MLTLRYGVVIAAEEPSAAMQRLEVEVDGERRPAVADVAIVGDAFADDEVVVNVQARDLELGSGGFDIVHVNLTRGIGGRGVQGAHVMKLNYTSLQHAVHPCESEQRHPLPPGRPVAVFSLHGQLPPVAWAIGQAAPGARVGYIQTGGGALPGGLSRAVVELRERGLLAGHITAGPAYGGELEAITTIGAIEHGLTELGWDAAICGPGPGILGSGSALGHGGMVALDSAHAALALGAPVVLVARMSSGDPRPRHRGLSHHTRTVLELLLGQVTIALPDGHDADVPRAPAQHRWRVEPADLDGYRAAGLPARTMGRMLDEDPPFFAAALAGGTALATMIAAR